MINYIPSLRQIMPEREVQGFHSAILLLIIQSQQQQFGLSAFGVFWKRDLAAAVACTGQITFPMKGMGHIWHRAITWTNLIKAAC